MILRACFLLLLSYISVTINAQVISRIELMGGVDYTNRILFDDQSSLDQTTLVGIRNKERGKSNWRLGLHVYHDLTKRFSIKSGIRYINLGYMDANAFVIVSDSELITVDDLVSVEVDKIVMESTLNLQYIEIPLIFRVTYPTNKFELFFEAGLSSMFFIGGKLTSRYASLEFEEVTNDLYFIETKPNFATQVGFGASFNILEQLYLTIQPSFRLNLRTHLNELFDERFYSAGLEAGVQYEF